MFRKGAKKSMLLSLPIQILILRRAFERSTLPARTMHERPGTAPPVQVANPAPPLGLNLTNSTGATKQPAPLFRRFAARIARSAAQPAGTATSAEVLMAAGTAAKLVR
ncbi:hypothetical protein PCL_05472 [Purpureocillium lilacinum]|uniref:Uncharacterized protein n=1 Tax=Purpureocillium lilacinum TaxID=33203 RepID=A0A2U3DUU7_PURLI|nr:hypothetical protein PCL_05472 [Purpureocillium lilacinum]